MSLPTAQPNHHLPEAGATSAAPRAALRWTGLWLAASAVLSLVGYAVLGTQFEWPDVLDEPGTTALDAFIEAETAVRIGFTGFALSSLVLVPAALAFQQASGREGWAVRSVTAFGVLGAFAQVLGWIRWPIAVPVLAERWRQAAGDEQARDAVAASYDVLNAYAGGALGEHLGWLLQGVWAVGLGVLVLRAALAPPWLALVGLVVSVGWALTVPLATSLGAETLEFWALNAYSVWYLWVLVVGVLWASGRRGPAVIGARSGELLDSAR